MSCRGLLPDRWFSRLSTDPRESENTTTWGILAVVAHSIALPMASISAARTDDPSTEIMGEGTRCITLVILWPIRIDRRADTLIGADLPLNVCPPPVADITVSGRLLERT